MNHRQKLSIAIPASIISDVPHLREKTLRIGLVGRAVAIFRVHEIIVFSDAVGSDQSKEARLIATILSYMETPQYLRKRLFKIKPELRYVGILPPLRTPHHPLINKLKDLTVGEYREGVVVASVKNGSLIDIGVERPILISKKRIPIDTRATVKIGELEETPRGVVVSHDEIEEYWGYQVVISNVTLGRLIRKRSFDLVVATSKYGIPFKQVIQKLVKRWKKSQKVLVAFGAPTRGLHEIVAQEGLKLGEVADLVVNTIPNQGTATVRTEEALYASLAILTSLVEK
ncbi:MAG: RNA methyltransferase [Candidatus Bathyarchaeota archaeon]|nr:RNA methyltransferase [Candidatus Bathyarchaeota archaeon]MDH5733071.1 RNA methyltransferase [Candidatus Bathyarchaeota archaeon]